MSAGKVLSILGGIIVLLSTYLLTFYSLGSTYGYGIAAWVNLTDLFTAVAPWYVYIAAVLIVLFLLSGFFLLIGAGKRGLAIFGGIFALLGGIYLLITILFNILPLEVEIYILWFAGDALVSGIIPFHVAIGNAGLGLYVLLGGAILGFIGGLIPRD
ncbi:MAG: hypothetical protein ACTSVX_03000 [Promethearchaeota archaeon]